MTVEQFDPNKTTTLETAKKTIAAQENSPSQSADKGSKVGFVSLG